jgi:hypothetical protein
MRSKGGNFMQAYREVLSEDKRDRPLVHHL